jgi:hypothetical protein
VTVATPPILGPEIVARRDGTCPKCPEPIVRGESYIRPVVGCGKKKWMHTDCASAYVRHLENYRQLNEELDETGSAAGQRDWSE